MLAKTTSPLKAERKRRGLTQAEMAQACGLSVGTYSLIERSPGPPSIDYQFQLAKGLRFSLAELQRVADWPMTQIPVVRLTERLRKEIIYAVEQAQKEDLCLSPYHRSTTNSGLSSTT